MAYFHNLTAFSLGIALVATAPIENGARANLLPPHHTSYCASLLTQLKEDHKVPQVSKSHTSAALSRLQDFMTRQLGETPAATDALSAQDLWIDSRAAKPEDLAQLTEQLRGLQFHRERGDDSGAVNRVIGTDIKGKQAISEFLERTKTSTLQISKFKPPRGFLDYFRYLLFYSDDALVAYFLQLVAPQLGPISAEIMQGDFSNIHRILIGIPLVTHYVEHLYRIGKSRNWKFDQQQDSLKKLAQSAASDRSWLYTSHVYRYPRRFAAALWTLWDGAQLGLSQELQMREHDRRTDTGRLLKGWILRGLAKKNEIEDIVLVDQLLSKDPSTGEPVLTVFMRLTVEEPQGPGRRKPTAKELEESLREAEKVLGQ